MTKPFISACLSLEAASTLHDKDDTVKNTIAKLIDEGKPFHTLVIIPASDEEAFGMVIQSEYVNVKTEDLKEHAHGSDDKERAGAYLFGAAARCPTILVTALNDAVANGDQKMVQMILEFCGELEKYSKGDAS